MAGLRLQGVRKEYPGGDVAVHEATFDVRDGEFLVLVGPSGCGKSTTLRMIAGLEAISAGKLYIGDRLVNDVPPSERDIAMVFQSYALYPHMTVRQNLAFALKMRKMARAEIDRRVNDAAAMLGLDVLLDKRPRSLSGGQRQRVAIGRAIVRQPQVFLFDEPLSNLDAKMRVQMRREIASLQHRLGVTTVYVTHDQVEAMTMGDRIVVMNQGRIQQVDTPLGLYERPATLFVAGFIGSPAMNLIKGRITQTRGLTFEAPDGAFTLPVPDRAASGLAAHVGGYALAGIRPEDLSLWDADRSPAASARIPMVVAAVEPLGSETLLYGRTADQEFTARIAPRSIPKEGESLDLVVDTSRLHFFDPATSARIGN
jgi:multiple sugar transport system ATP-binding protein